MAQLEHIEAIEKRLWNAADTLRANLLAIVWLYRGETAQYLDLVAEYGRRTVDGTAACFETVDENGKKIEPLPEFLDSLNALIDALNPVFKAMPKKGAHIDAKKELDDALAAFNADVAAFRDGNGHIS